jgi:hypothetical protein
VTASTPKGLAWDGCKDLARSVWIRARSSAHASISEAARVIGVDHSHASRWESERCNHPVPLAVLWSRDAVPDAQLEVLIEQVRADRGAAVERSLLSTPEGALRRLMREANSLLGLCLTILDDGKASPTEKLDALRALDEMEAVIRRTKRALIASDRGAR